MTLAKRPVVQSPDHHNHLATFETFTVLKGEFLINWNDDGSEELVLKMHDTISIPLVYVDLLQIIITGGVHDMNDISFTPFAISQMEKIEPNLSKKFEDVGFKFNAGI